MDFILSHSPLDSSINCVNKSTDFAKKQEPPHVVLRGTSLRPLCHFELDPSDYLSGDKRNPELRGPTGAFGPLDAETRVIEIHSVGVKVFTQLFEITLHSRYVF